MEKWNKIIIRIEKELRNSGLKNPNIRLNALKKIDSILDNKYKNEPSDLLKIGKLNIKVELIREKGYDLNSAELSIINHIFTVINNEPLPIKGIEYRNANVKTDTKKNDIFNNSKVSFEPFISKQSKILILGTMPGDDSLKTAEYYHKLQNCFWKIIFDVFNPNNFSKNYENRLKLLADNQIGLWDVLSYCNRMGSLDIDIRDVEFNDIDGLLKENPNITKIIFNGEKASKYFVKSQFQSTISKIILPSTSSANTKSYAEKLRIWKTALIDY